MANRAAALKKEPTTYEPRYHYPTKRSSPLTLVRSSFEEKPGNPEPLDYRALSDERAVSLFVESGDEEAFNQIVNRYRDIIYGYAMKLTRSPDDAEEILQDVFLILVEKLHTFRGNSKFSTWLYRIIVNACYMHVKHTNRKRDHEVSVDSYESPDHPAASVKSETIGPDEALLRRERMKLINEATDELSESNRLIFRLKEIEGFSNKEVGKVVGISVSAVKSRILRTRLYLRKKLVDYRSDMTC